jgi:glycosyltransferase involved in cell wall biosynthesis
MKILMVLSLPWRRELGGARIQLELADELTKLGHEVDHFSADEAFRGPARTSLLRPREVVFPRLAGAFVRARGQDYDVIDALEGDLPYTASDLGTSGLVVARSLGLRLTYEEFRAEAGRRWPQAHGRTIARPLRAWHRRQAVRLGLRSLERADLSILPNAAEETRVRAMPGVGGQVVRIPFGLAHERREALAGAARSRRRATRHRIAFVGTFDQRKGAHDLPGILRRVRQAHPEASLRLLGTAAAESEVRARFDPLDQAAVEVIEGFPSSDLPDLLGDCSVGLFPSYVEGFGFGALELLAAGLPTVAYDVPGPQDILRRAGRAGRLVERGDVSAAAAALLALFERDPATLAQDACATAKHFAWEDIARATMDAYRDAKGAPAPPLTPRPHDV